MTLRARRHRRLVCEWSPLVVGVYAAFGPWINPSVAVDSLLRIDLFLLALFGLLVFALGVGTDKGEREWAEEPKRRPPDAGGGTAGRRSLGPSILVGGLLGAAFVAPWAAFPWLVGPALVVAWAGRGTGGGKRCRGLGLATVVLVMVLNSALLASVSARGLRESPELFQLRDFRVNRLLPDVPLHDVWAVDLPGHPSPTLDDLADVFSRFSPLQASPVHMGLGMIREVACQALGWEDPRWNDPESSLIHRLTEDDRRRSATDPGTMRGIWKVLYAFPREGVVETMNGTVHVAVAGTIGDGPRGPRLFLSFWVREVNWTTSLYMRLIDPSRRYFVYPSLLRQFAHTWEREGRKRSQDLRIGGKQ
jgi:hypothetical protein